MHLEIPCNPQKHISGEENQVHKRNFKSALNLACEYYGDNKLKKKDVWPTKLVDFESIVERHNLNTMLYERKKGSEKDVGSIWRLSYGKH